MADGIDLSAYDLANAAQDIEDLRTVLGIERWNIQGNGNANLLAFEVARLFPDGIRSLTADSPNLLAPDQFTSGPAAFEIAIDRLATACAAQAACAQAIPDVRASIDAMVEKLDASPITIELPPAGSRAATTVAIDGASFLRWTRAMIGEDGGRGISAMLSTLAQAREDTIHAGDPIVEGLAPVKNWRAA